MNQRFTLDEQISAVIRELRFRRSVYARRVSDGKMKQHQADREIALMEAVRDTLQSLIDSDPLRDMRS